jgi:O-antigen ligase
MKVALCELSAFWAILFLGWAIARRQARLSGHILFFPLFLYGLASTVSAIVNGRFLVQDGEGVLWFKMLILPAALILFREVPRLRPLALTGHILFGSMAALYALYEFIVLGYRDLEHRITGPFPHVMTFSGVILPISLLLLVLWRRQRRAWMLAPLIITTTALLLTFTRSAWLAWIVAVFTILILNRSRLSIFVAAALVLFIALMPLDLFSRVVSSFDMSQSSNLDRLRMLEAGSEIIRDYPLFGVGPSNIKEVYPIYRSEDAPRFRIPHLHNNVVQIWAERGLLALMAYGLLIALFLRECARAWNGPARPFAEAGVAVTVALACAGLFEFNFGDTEVFYLLLNLYALLVAEMEAGVAGIARFPEHRTVNG